MSIPGKVEAVRQRYATIFELGRANDVSVQKVLVIDVEFQKKKKKQSS